MKCGTNKDHAELICDTCIKYGLLPNKSERKTQAIRNHCSKFKGKLENNSQENSQILIDLVIKLIQDKSTLNDNIKSNYLQEFKDIINTRGPPQNDEEGLLVYLNTSVEDICVSLSRQSNSFRQQRTEIQEKLYNDTKEYQRIIENKNKTIESLQGKISSLEAALSQSEKTREKQFEKLLEYDSDTDEEIEEIYTRFIPKHTIEKPDPSLEFPDLDNPLEDNDDPIIWESPDIEDSNDVQVPPHPHDNLEAKNADLEERKYFERAKAIHESSLAARRKRFKS
jgi:hypothetical protein